MKSTKDLKDILKKQPMPDLDQFEKLTFQDYLQLLMKDTQMEAADIIAKTNIQRTYFYQILNGQKKPGKDKVIQIALAMQLDEKQANRLLSLSDHGSLYPKIPTDAIFLYCIYHHKSVMECSLMLEEHGLPGLS